jgi:hypothetical protein
MDILTPDELTALCEIPTDTYPVCPVWMDESYARAGGM